MADVLSSADALVHSTAGLTVLEALVLGCPTISYGWGRAHIRANNAAFARHGLAEVARTPAELRDALRQALGTRRDPYPSWASWPTAAGVLRDRFLTAG
jgi:processive 1,2-diacylglycerol beta-glucosyltransferase